MLNLVLSRACYTISILQMRKTRPRGGTCPAPHSRGRQGTSRGSPSHRARPQVSRSRRVRAAQPRAFISAPALPFLPPARPPPTRWASARKVLHHVRAGGGGRRRERPPTWDGGEQADCPGRGTAELGLRGPRTGGVCPAPLPPPCGFGATPPPPNAVLVCHMWSLPWARRCLCGGGGPRQASASLT